MDTPTPWDSVRHDVYTFRFAMDHLRRARPRVVYLALGETDDWAHDGRYDRVLETYARTDAYLKELWTWLQSDPEYPEPDARAHHHGSRPWTQHQGMAQPWCKGRGRAGRLDGIRLAVHVQARRVEGHIRHCTRIRPPRRSRPGWVSIGGPYGRRPVQRFGRTDILNDSGQDALQAPLRKSVRATSTLLLSARLCRPALLASQKRLQMQMLGLVKSVT